VKTASFVAPDPTPVAAPAPDPVTEETYFCAPTQAYDWDDSDEEPDQEAEEEPVELAAAAEEEEADPLTRTQTRRPIIVRGRDSDDEPLG